MSSSLRCPRCGSKAATCHENTRVHVHSCFDCALIVWYRSRGRDRHKWERFLEDERARYLEAQTRG